ncbi:MAG: exopolysaccharide biosynthesis polyprenyl glycosylphosphotransferase [Candidatus Nomurabacteria bacterium]|jgi:undecaprenyl-phosphate galactose phosphotransferase|nr:exopolysaccharide biosynthesis polyprenyl glycosylphosphotransferase [Candidatus Nomurabacteria bacterium]
MFKKNSHLLDFAFLIGDALLLVAAFIGAYILRVNLDPRPLLAPVFAHDFLISTLIITPFWLIIFATLGLYNPKTSRKPFRFIPRIIFGTCLGMMALISFQYLFDLNIFPARLVIFYALVFTILAVIILRLIILFVARFFRRHHQPRILLVGNSATTRDIAEQILTQPETGQVVATFGIKIDNIPDFSDTDEVIKNLRKLKLDSIIQTDVSARDRLAEQLLNASRNRFISYNFIAEEPEFYNSRNQAVINWGYPIVTISETPLVGWNLIVKRLFDLFWVIILSPIWLIVFAILVLCQKLFNRGPIFFIQKRLGQYGKTFKLLKFRTMNQKFSGQDAIAIFEKMGRKDLANDYAKNRKIAQDPRVDTLFGKFLRATSLDELPQILHILSGKMSIIGPRPILPDERDFYKSNDSVLFSIKPGLTSLASVSGRSNLPFAERVKLEIFYVSNWSIIFDIKIFFRTIKAVICRDGSF